jgi:hypothetical protein
MKSTDETKALAKEAGIKSWHVKSEEKLQAELTETVNAGEQDEKVIEVGSVATEESDSEEHADSDEEVLELPDTPERHVLIFSIKVAGPKSPYYKYKKLLGM